MTLQTFLAFIRRQRYIALAAFLGIVCFLFFLNIIEEVITGDSALVDKKLLLRAGQLATSPAGNWMTPLAKSISLLGNWQGIIPLGVTLLFLAWRRRIPWRAFLFFVVSCAGCAALILGFKFLIARPRPDIVPALEKAPFLSFPSGHAAYALVGWGFVAYLIARRSQMPTPIRILLALGTLFIAGIVGASRIYLAAHYPSDVAGGLLMGAPWLITVLFLYENSIPSRQKRRNPDGSLTRR